MKMHLIVYLDTVCAVTMIISGAQMLDLKNELY